MNARELDPQRTLLSLSLLRPFRATLGHEPVTGLHTRKGQALLAYLVVEASCSYRREALAELFCPERTEGVARASLRQALLDVRRAILAHKVLDTTLDAVFGEDNDTAIGLSSMRGVRGETYPLLTIEELSCDQSSCFEIAEDREAIKGWVQGLA